MRSLEEVGFWRVMCNSTTATPTVGCPCLGALAVQPQSVAPLAFGRFFHQFQELSPFWGFGLQAACALLPLMPACAPWKTLDYGAYCAIINSAPQLAPQWVAPA